MKKLILPLLIGLLACGGCARHYTITLSNGTQIGAKGKPKRQGSLYVFTDATGKESSVSVGRVKEIAPRSMMKDKPEPFKPSTIY